MRAKSLRLIAFLVFAIPAAGPAFGEEPRVEIHLNGLFAWGDFDFSQSRSFRVLGYDLPVTAAYDLDSAFGFDGGVQLNVTGSLGFRASVSHATHQGAGRLTATLPPILPGLPGTIDASLPDGRVSETDVHVSAVGSLEMGPARVSALGGVTFFDLTASLADSIDVALPGMGRRFDGPGLDVSDSPVGWHVGVGVDVHVAPHVALGAFVRYAQATARLAPPFGDAIELDAGGAHGGVGVRLLF